MTGHFKRKLLISGVMIDIALIVHLQKLPKGKVGHQRFVFSKMLE
jgi:hypothetical protein